MRSGGVQGRSEGVIGGQGRSREVREVRVGQERSGKCRRGQQGLGGMAGEVVQSVGGQEISGESNTGQWTSRGSREVQDVV